MSLSPGTRLGPFEIVALVGAGGMGEVYKGRDTRLNRTVAIKVLPQQVSSQPELKQRFEREAQTIAGLNHPNICALYDVGQHEGVDYLVMEYLEGETLAQRLERGALPLDHVLKYAIEISGALEKAHQHSVIHRDLKPSNIMLTRSGAKLLDFGLAKLKQDAHAPSALSALPTNVNLTAEGAILGTLQYMAPEQLEGKEADARTDVFAFGAVLYEMATGRKAFEGKSQASLIVSIMEHEPPAMSSTQPIVPRHLDHHVRRCLAKAPEARWQTASDLHEELKWVAETIAQGLNKTAETQVAVKRWRRPIPLVATGLIALVTAIAASLAVWMSRTAAPEGSSAVTRLSVALPVGDQVALANPGLALSPDGMQLAYVGIRQGKQQLFLRPLDGLESKPIPATEGAINPFFSPDGQWVGFFAQGKLKKVSVNAGAIQILCDAPGGGGGQGGSWGPDNSIYFALTSVSGLWKVSAAGGTPTEVTRLDRSNGEVSHRWPQLLPGGKAVLFTVWTGPGWDQRQIHAQSLETGERHLLVRGGDTGRHVSTGQLVYAARGDALMAVPMDLGRLEVTGAAPVPLAEQVRGGGEGVHYAVSNLGELAYVPGSVRRFEHRLVWVDRKGAVEPLSAPTREYVNAAISPDGSQAAVEIYAGTLGVWIYDFSRATLIPFTTPNSSSQAPVWTPDGSRVVYRGTRGGFRNLFWKDVDATSEEERLTTKEDTNQTPGSWSPDRTWLAFSETSQSTGTDIWLLHLNGDRKPQAFLATQFDERNPRLSPDGRWLAYTSNESGRMEVYVQPFPGPGGKRLISTEGGTEPVWSRNGRELFYLSGDKFMAVDIATQPTLSAGSPRLLFEGRYVTSLTGSSGYDISPDGQRFLRVQAIEPDLPATQINVVFNWFEELKQRVPAAK